jgi:type IV secretory pathway component VirB8
MRRASPEGNGGDPRSHIPAGQLLNTPPVVDGSPKRTFAALHGDTSVFGARCFVLAAFMGVIVIVQGVALAQLIPLKTTTAYIVEPRQDGLAVHVPKPADFKPQNAYVQAEIGRFVRRVMLIDPHRTRDEQKAALAVLRGKAVAEHRQLLEEDQVFRRMLETPDLVRTVDAVSVDVSKEGIAFVFVTTTERVGQNTPRTQKWRFALHYALIPPESEEQIMANPVGLAITHIERRADAS